MRQRRNELGLSQEATAERMQITTRHFQKIEAGDLNLTLRTLCRLADALHIKPADLLRKE
jgi:transcriptional regulator with XRE-family HTH domain